MPVGCQGLSSNSPISGELALPESKTAKEMSIASLRTASFTCAGGARLSLVCRDQINWGEVFNWLC